MPNPSHVFLDTSGFIAILNRDDEWHEKASLLLEEINQSGKILITTDWILAETGNGLARTKARSLFVGAVRSFLNSPRCRLIPINTTLLDKALNHYDKHQDKTWGLVDCVSFVLMKDEGVQEALTADQHFRQAGFTCLLSFA